MTFKTLALLFCLLSVHYVSDASGSLKNVHKKRVDHTYYIEHAGIMDHGDPATIYSIAWYLATYGQDGTYVLVSLGKTYNIHKTLILPANSKLIGKDSITANWRLLAGEGLDGKTMVVLNNNSTLKNISVDGGKKASILVSLSNATSINVEHCVITDSKNNNTTDVNLYTILINATGAANITVKQCLLKRAGCEPKLNEAINKSLGYGIRLLKSKNLVIDGNRIEATLTCGIDVTGSSIVLINKNVISETGINRRSTGAVADAITGYHNWNTEAENFTITRNVINGAYNHGIHVSGKGLNIQNNIISNHYLSGIMVDDWRNDKIGTNEFSENVVIKNNRIDDPESWGPQPGNSNRKIFVDRVNKNTTIDFGINQDLRGALLQVASSNYHLPTLYGTL